MLSRKYCNLFKDSSSRNQLFEVTFMIHLKLYIASDCRHLILCPVVVQGLAWLMVDEGVVHYYNTASYLAVMRVFY